MTTRIHLYDTTLRDGTQREGLSLSASDKVKIAARLDAFGIDTIEGGWPGSNPKDAEFFRRVQTRPLCRARVAAFGSTRRVGTSCDEDPSIQALVAANTSVVTIVGKSSTTHVRLVLETTREENLRLIADTVAYFRALGKDVVYDAEHFFDGLALDAAYALETLEAARDAGASVLVLCDTNGGSEPRAIASSVSSAARRVRAPLGIHPHNDRGLALANALAAIDAGCVHAQGTVNGYGERCGNLDLLALVANLQGKRGMPCVSDDSLATLTELSHYVASVANLAPDAHAPFVGRAAFAHKGGIHVAAVAKDPAMYQHMDPVLVGNHMRVVVSELSGRANVRLRASSLGLDARPVERAVLEQVKALDHAGAQLEAAEGTFEMLVRRATPGYVVPFELREYTVVVARRVWRIARARDCRDARGRHERAHVGRGRGAGARARLGRSARARAAHPRGARDTARRLQGPDHRRASGHRRDHARARRNRVRRRAVDHDRRGSEHSGCELGRDSRFARAPARCSRSSGTIISSRRSPARRPPCCTSICTSCTR